MAELAVAGLILGAAGTVMSGIQQNKIAKANARAVESKAKVDASIQEKADEVTQATALARANAGGFAGDSESALIIEAENEFSAELNQINILSGAKSRADILRFEGKSARNAAFFKAGGTLLTGAGGLSAAGGGGSL